MYRRALERENWPSRSCALPARRISSTSRPRKSSVGPKLTSTLSHQGAPVWSGSALTTTCLLSNSWASAVLSANAGISVAKRVVACDPP
jgi:hypothetical protein